MPDTLVYPADNPLMSAFTATRGALVKSPAAFARTLIKEHASTHWHLEVDPDTARIMTFTFSAPPARPPYPATVVHSLTLTEALLHSYHRRIGWFNGFGYVQPYKDGGLDLQPVEQLDRFYPVHSAEGLYRQSTPAVYDASTHINIPPADFKKFVNDADLRRRYQAYLKTFWADNGQHYPLLAKAAFLKAAFVQASEKSLREADRQLALRAAGLPAVQQWSALTPAQLQPAAVADPHVQVSPLKIHRYSATDILVIKDTRAGRVLLYIPGNSSPLHGFASEQDMADWLAEQCRDPSKRLALEAHFRARDDSDGLFLSGLHTTLQGVAVYPRWLSYNGGSWPPRHLIHSGAKISGDAFVFIRDSVEQRLQSDAKSVIRSHGDERLEGIAQGLSNSLLFTGLVALIVPEAIPFILGLSVTLTGVGSAQAAQGKTFEQRQLGLKRAEFGLLNALPIVAEKVMTLAAEASVATPPTESIAVAGGGEAAAETSVPLRPRFDYEPPALRALSPPLRQSLRAFEAPAKSVQGQPTIHGPNGMLDIHHDNGHYFLAVHNRAYEVRWEDSARRWRIISADGQGRAGPYVRQLDNDQWDIDEGGLKGGMDTAQAAAPEPGPSLNAQVKALYPGFSAQQIAGFLAELRASGTSLEIQLARLATDFKSLERSLARWVQGPLSWGPRIENLSIPVSADARRRAAQIITRCWQRQTPVEGVAARHIPGYTLDLSGVPMGDLPYLPGDLSHVTAINLSRTFTSHLSISGLLIKCPNLRWLNIENNFLQRLPDGLRGLSQLTRLTLASNRITLTADMMNTLRRLSNLRLLNLEHNPLGPLLDVSGMPHLLNLFLRNTGIHTLPHGLCELAGMLAVDLRGNLISSLPEEFYTTNSLAQHTLLDGNPLSAPVRGRLALMRIPVFSQPRGDTLDFWLELTPEAGRSRRRDIWSLFLTQEQAADFFEVIARLEGTADFEINPQATAQRVWHILEAGAVDESLRSRLVAMAAQPETCADGAAAIFSAMELEVLVNSAHALAVAGRRGAQLLKLVRGLYRLEEVDALARLDAAARVGFVEDVEVMLAYRTGLASRLDLPVATRAMVFNQLAEVSQQTIDRAGQAVLTAETPEGLAAFALHREFWVSYLENEYREQFVLCQRPTAERMDALDEQQSRRPLTDGAYKEAAEAILQQRRLDEQALMKQLTLSELERIDTPNDV